MEILLNRLRLKIDPFCLFIQQILMLCGTTLFLFVFLIIENSKFLLGKMFSKYFEKKYFKYLQLRYDELEIKEFCDKFSTGTFHRSKWRYEVKGLDARYIQDENGKSPFVRLEQLIQKLIDDEIIIPIDPWNRRDETDYKIKSANKEKILRRIHSKIIKKEKKGKK